MVEICTKKKMVICILVLFSISLLILVIESAWSTHRSMKVAKAVAERRKQGKGNETCPKGKEKVVSPCTKCSKYELRIEAPVCQKWGYKETIQCEDGKNITRTCDFTPDMDETQYWIFELVTLTLFILSYLMVRRRQKLLDRTLMDKINKQIASGI